MKKLFLFLFLLFPVLANAATLTVCSSGCDYTTITTAIAAAAPTDEIEIQENIVEAVVLNKNIAEIRGTGDRDITWSTATGNLFEIQSGLTQAFTLQNLTLDVTASIGETIKQTSAGTGCQVTIYNCLISRTSTVGGDAIEVANFNFTNGWTIDRCDIVGNATTNSGIAFTTATNTDVATIKNCTVRSIGGTPGRGIEIVQSSVNQVAQVFNTTINGCDVGYYSGSAGEILNCVFTNNTDDLTLINQATSADFSYCAFEEQTDFGGTGNIFGIISGDQYVNETIGDLHVKNQSADIFNAGTAIAGLTVDLDLVTRPQAGVYDIGAYELEVSPTPTITRTITLTHTPIGTPTVTPTISPTRTPGIEDFGNDIYKVNLTIGADPGNEVLFDGSCWILQYRINAGPIGEKIIIYDSNDPGDFSLYRFPIEITALNLGKIIVPRGMSQRRWNQWYADHLRIGLGAQTTAAGIEADFWISASEIEGGVITP